MEVNVETMSFAYRRRVQKEAGETRLRQQLLQVMEENISSMSRKSFEQDLGENPWKGLRATQVASLTNGALLNLIRYAIRVASGVDKRTINGLRISKKPEKKSPPARENGEWRKKSRKRDYDESTTTSLKRRKDDVHPVEEFDDGWEFPPVVSGDESASVSNGTSGTSSHRICGNVSDAINNTPSPLRDYADPSELEVRARTLVDASHPVYARGDVRPDFAQDRSNGPRSGPSGDEDSTRLESSACLTPGVDATQHEEATLDFSGNNTTGPDDLTQLMPDYGRDEPTQIMRSPYYPHGGTTDEDPTDLGRHEATPSDVLDDDDETVIDEATLGAVVDETVVDQTVVDDAVLEETERENACM